MKKAIYILLGCAIALVIAAIVCIPFSTMVKGKPVEEKCMVYFNTQGGTAIDDLEVEKNGKIHQPENPVLAGYIFDGWYQDEACEILFNFEKDVIEENTRLYAKWEPASKLEVIFNTMGGSTIQVVIADRDKPLAEPDQPEKLDYVFGGWYQNQSCSEGQEWNFESDVVTAPMTLYAKWIAVTSYQVTFNTMGGNNLPSVEVAKGGKISTPATPVKAGCVFVGWYQDEACSEGQEWNFATDTVNANMTLYAKWQ